MESNLKTKNANEVDKDMKDEVITQSPGVQAYCRSLAEQGLEFRIIPLVPKQSNTKT